MADPRPLIERAADTLVYPLAFRMNRSGRSDGTLFMRGSVILVLACAICFAAAAAIFHVAMLNGQGGAFQMLLVAFSTGTIGWYAPMRALGKAIGNTQAPRPYLVLARATYSNLVPLDEGGLIRVAATACIRSVTLRMVAPPLLFALFGWQVLAIYWPVMVLALAMGQDGTSRAFAVMANGVATLLLLIPSLVAFPIVLATLFFSAGASFFRALPAVIRLGRWPSLLQGGLSTMLVAYAMKLMLGGPRQDRSGNPVAGSWIGPEGGTAKLEPADIGRVLYFQVVALLLFATAFYALTVFA